MLASAWVITGAVAQTDSPAVEETVPAAGTSNAAPTIPSAPSVPAAFVRCHERAQRTLRRHTEFTSFSLAADPDPREIKPRGKFTPRFPVDVNRVVQLRGSAENKKTKTTVEAELWCGYLGERLVAADIVAVRK